MKRSCVVILAISMALLCGVATAASSTATGQAGGAPAASTTVVARGIRIADHPAYVRAVIDFTGTSVGSNPQVLATDAQPLDGRAEVQYVIAPGVRTTAVPAQRLGLKVSVVKNARGLRIALQSTPLRFKYLSYTWVTNHHLAIDMWKSAPPSKAAEIHRGTGGCLTLDDLSLPRTDGVVDAAGREHGVFEHQFLVVLRGADGRVLAKRPVHARGGRWSAELVASSRRSQAATFEAVALSPADGALVCLVQQRTAVAYTGPAPLRLTYKAHADIDGDGHLDLVVVQPASQHRGGLLQVTLASGRRLSVSTSTSASALPALAAVGNVNGRRGDELFVDVEHISTNEFIAVYTYSGGQLRRAATLPGYSAHPGLWSGMTCSTSGSDHLITVHQFALVPLSQPRYWTRQDTDYVWRGAVLKLRAAHLARRIPGLPPPSLVGLHCGHSPRP